MRQHRLDERRIWRLHGLTTDLANTSKNRIHSSLGLVTEDVYRQQNDKIFAVTTVWNPDDDGDRLPMAILCDHGQGIVGDPVRKNLYIRKGVLVKNVFNTLSKMQKTA